MQSKAIILIEDVHGIYIPQWFATKFDLSQWGIADADADILMTGPSHDHYWDAWDDVLKNARYQYDGNVWRLHQDGDLWAVTV